MKRKLTFIVALAFMAISVATVNNKIEQQQEVVDAAYTTNASTYYSSVGSLSGDALLEKLATISKSNHKYYTTYEDCRTMCPKSDKDPNNSSNFIDFYSGLSMPGTWNSSVWNREHVWCQSLSGGLFTSTAESDKGAGGDIHHIRPLIDNINSSRNNNVYGEVSNRNSYKKYYDSAKDSAASTVTSGTLFGYLNGGVFEPRDTDKGDIARILMYLYMHYSNEVSANSSHSYAGNLKITNITSASTATAAWDMLVDWSNSDSVSTLEKSRNEYCASVTGVRNPFVDHPEYANYIWGGQTNTGDSSSGSGSSGSDSSGSSGSGSSGSDSSGSSGDQTIIIPGTTVTETVYRKLSSANGITNGSKIIIVASDYDKALSNNQKDTARGVTAITKYTSGSYSYITPSSNTAIFTVGGSSGAWTLKDSNGYLAATSSSANELKSRSSVTGNNCKWAINFSSGNANIVSQGSYTRNTLKYSSSSEFTCYAASNDLTSDKPVSIYKEYTETYTTPDQEIVIPGTGNNSGSGSTSAPSAGTTLTIPQAIEVASAYSHNTFSTDEYIISGTVKSIDNETYGNMYIEDEQGNSILIYGVYDNTGDVRYDAMPTIHKPKVGDVITLSGVLGMYSTTPEMKNANIVDLNKSATSELKTLFDTYTGDKTYTKKSTINLNSSSLEEVAKYFHAGIASLQRTTYYKDNSLLMTDYDGTLTNINSGYGTDSNGNLTHFKIDSNGNQVIDYTVDATGGMEGYFTTPYDFTATNYFDSNWVYEYGVGYSYTLSSTSASNKYLQNFLDAAAPLLLSNIYSSNYVQIEKLVIKENNNSLILQIVVSSTNSGVLANLVTDQYVLAESVITSDCNTTYL